MADIKNFNVIGGAGMKVGLMGFGKAGKAVASVLLESKEANLQWVIRKTTYFGQKQWTLQHGRFTAALFYN